MARINSVLLVRTTPRRQKPRQTPRLGLQNTTVHALVHTRSMRDMGTGHGMRIIRDHAGKKDERVNREGPWKS